MFHKAINIITVVIKTTNIQQLGPCSLVNINHKNNIPTTWNLISVDLITYSENHGLYRKAYFKNLTCKANKLKQVTGGVPAFKAKNHRADSSNTL